MNLKMKTGTAGYNNKILVSDGKFSLGKNDKVNSLEPAKVIALEPSIKSYKAIAQPLPVGAQAPTQTKKPATHKDEKLLLYFSDRWFCHMEYFLMNLSLRFWIQNLIRLLM